ncbi:general L-amino acid transport system permease protein [Rhizobium leguminosarum]|uniref:General L-amino acid transport system permease protein n=1 Tax=Rhizobium leguminosarum TaxID=384 RepID=A0AAE2MNV5_RHILE|nr:MULTISPECIES: amino acid ABC transporter permease [Rhizobium]MBB4292234.1 general L-amino acid transport system permease protein [Rhizobium leguminosarum]MBB4299783.1 general L-amino acid transport system permease protein [Rhizobium leguminosarum]MBB4309828.1 general L-amino acid transport system permease protein [Rhizobium leguminosarum]MBB4419432.1 general L-amino acid transport system permease protein [Rhizobium leguminosarum]MBB4434235.1 general L-amino acid transport system permease pr
MSELQVVLPKRRRPLTAGLFDNRRNTVITLLCIAVVAWFLVPFLHWAVGNAVWAGSAQDCSAGDGACWAFVAAKFRFIIFGFYPPALQWRPALVILGIGILLFISTRPSFWSLKLLMLWLVVVPLAWLLMAGTLLPPAVPSSQWGGLPITILVSVIGLATAFPVALLLAFARRSSMGILRTLAVVFIECLRGVPLIVVLYVAMLIVPMALPTDALVDKLLRAQIGISLFVSAYLAEVIRAGLQSIPEGQTEAAYSLGLGYWRTAQLVVLPQALRAVIPAIVNLSIGILLNTALLAVIGILDLLNAAKTAATDPNWLGFYTETFIFVACIYFAISYGASRYSLWLERRLRADRQ